LAIRNFMFDPSNLTVPVGTTVRATNYDGAAHTWTSSGHWDSGKISTGQVFAYRFATKGVFSFVCSYHAIMTGQVTVS
jgi:plastocyanin